MKILFDVKRKRVTRVFIEKKKNKGERKGERESEIKREHEWNNQTIGDF